MLFFEDVKQLYETAFSRTFDILVMRRDEAPSTAEKGPRRIRATTTLWRRGYLIPSPRRHELEMLVALYLKDKLHSDLQDARRIISADTAEDTCWIDGRGDCTEV